MKKLLSCVLLVVSAPALASSPYLVEPMICKGLATGDTHNLPSSTFQIAMEFASFLATRKDGSLANALELKNYYFARSEPAVIEEGRYDADWYMGPLERDRDQVVLRNLSGRLDDLHLTILSSKQQNGKQVDGLEGSWTIPQAGAGSYSYRLRCEATVVARPSRVQDLTKKQ